MKEWSIIGETKCPNGCEKLRVIEAHPLLKRALSKLEVQCENTPNGCDVKVAYDDIF